MIISKKTHTLILIFFNVLLLQPAQSHATKNTPTKRKASTQESAPSLWERFKNQLSWELFGTKKTIEPIYISDSDSSDSDSSDSDSEEEQEKSIPGLENFGNSCYFNATMQCLASLQPLTNCLQHAKKPKAFRQSYLDLVNQMNGDDNSTITPADLFEKVTKGQGWDPDHQQDAQEFYNALIDRLFRKLKRAGKNELCSSIYTSNSSTVWDNAGHQSLRFEGSNPQILLEIPKGEPTLTSCLDSYFAPENLVRTNQWACEDCGRKVNAKKQLALTTFDENNEETLQFPEILVLTLRRFKTNATGLITSKVTTAVPFPMHLNIKADWVHESSQEHCPSYDLVGFVVQGGSLNGGHYWSYTKRNDQWYHCNDTHTEPQTDAQIKAITESGLDADGKATPYLLFYQKRNIAVAAPRRTHKAK